MAGFEAQEEGLTGPTVQVLEQEVERLTALPAGRTEPVAVPTGLTVLDEALPGGGLPRGRVVEWDGPPSSGKISVLRSSLLHLRHDGESVAWIDGSGGLYAPHWVPLLEGPGEFWIVRPSSPLEATWCADLLLRSGAFGAVTMRMGDGLRRATSVRLQRLAEESASLFVTVGPVDIAALRLGFRPGRVEPLGGALFGPRLPAVRPVWVRIGKRGNVQVPVLCPSPTAWEPSVTRDRKGPL